MELFYRKSGSGKPIIILHGLYGSGDNWYSIAREISGTNTVYLVDQRNHGNSPHNPVHDYKSLSDDLNEFMHAHHIDKSILIGHSMGGKTALAFGLIHPEMVEKMIVVDISPLGYSEDSESPESHLHRHIITSLQAIDIHNINNRGEADRQLTASISSPMIRQFLLKSLKRKHDGKFEWALNLKALAGNMTAIFDGVIREDITDPRSIPEFPLLFIKGEKSGYMRENDLKAIVHYFPHARIITIPNAGHWVHAEQPEAFIAEVKQFIG
ncbi:MAG TPA: alpha/beta fold hydrolase [Bacteroidales bacterium]|jgi:pimeloyl-ACP methyl ester carboxylesterase|nr:alpha/beta fold hydrolase [Bacteroidales bacterium]